MDSFAKLHELSRENGVSLEEIAVYALSEGQSEE
jgi:hypothetical protein